MILGGEKKVEVCYCGKNFLACGEVWSVTLYVGKIKLIYFFHMPNFYFEYFIHTFVGLQIIRVYSEAPRVKI